MLDVLNKYTHTDHFFFEPSDSLVKVCNAPTNFSGIYVVYALTKGKVKLIYIGRSGKKNKDGSIFIRKSGLGGIKDRIVNGHQFGKTPRRISWPIRMIQENIEALDIYWYVTHNSQFIDCPRLVETTLLQSHLNIYNRLPLWNKEL